MERSPIADSARQSPTRQATSTSMTTQQQQPSTPVVGSHALSISRPASQTAPDRCPPQTHLHKGASCPISSAPTSPPQASPSAPPPTAAADRVPDDVSRSRSPAHKERVVVAEHQTVLRTHSVLRSGPKPSNLHSSSGSGAGARRRTDRPKSVRLVVGVAHEEGACSLTHSPADDDHNNNHNHHHHRDSHQEKAKDKQVVVGGDSSSGSGWDPSSVVRGQSLDRQRDRPAFFVRFLKRRSTSSKFAAHSRGSKSRGSLPLVSVSGSTTSSSRRTVC